MELDEYESHMSKAADQLRELLLMELVSEQKIMPEAADLLAVALGEAKY